MLFKGRRTTFPNTRVKPAFRSVDNATDDDVGGTDDDVGDVLEDDVGDAMDDVGDAMDDVGDAMHEVGDEMYEVGDAMYEVGDAVENDIGDSEANSDNFDAYITDVVKNPRDERFENAIKAEMSGLLSRDVFVLVSDNAVPPGSNIMGSKFHLVVKNAETTQPVYKARLVIFGHMDAEKGRILSEAPTVSQMSIRTLISLSVVNAWPIWSRDIRQAFLQSESLLSRTVYMRPPRQLQETYKGPLMRLKKPLYGIIEAPSYWYDTYIPAFKAPPTSMTQSFLDECLLFTVPPVTHSDVITDDDKDENAVRLHGMAGVLVDDALLTGNASFAAAEQAMHDLRVRRQQRRQRPS